MEVSFGYKKVKFPSDPKTCSKFLEYIRKGPQDFLKSAQDVLGDGDKLSAESIKEKAKVFSQKLEEMTGRLG